MFTYEAAYELTDAKLANARRKLAKMRARSEAEPIVDPLGRTDDGAAHYLVWTDHSDYIVTFYREAVTHRRMAACECAAATHSSVPRGCYHVAEAFGKHLTWALREQSGDIIRPVAAVPRPRNIQARITRFLADAERKS